MKEGLEKYFESGVTEPDKLPDTEPQTAEQQELPLEPQEETVVQPQEEVVQPEEVVEEIQQTVQGLEEIVEEPVQELTVQETIKQPAIELPENVEKLVSFLNDNPNATLEDYVGLNKSFDDANEKTVLKEYYKQTKSHLDQEDVDYLLGKKFDYDPESLEEEEVRERKIALKEELSQAKTHLNANKDKYYAELKANVGHVAGNEELLASQAEAKRHFQSETDKAFEGFKGFDFDLGEGNKTLRYKVENADKLKDYQSDLDNVLGDFLEDGKMKDAKGYHKALFAAKNADKIAQLFYEQGKADAVKSATKESKNVDFSHTHRAPASDTKLQPGVAREITNHRSNEQKINLKYWDKK